MELNSSKSISNIFFIGDNNLISSDLYKISSVEDCLEYFKNHTSIQVDTETEGKDPHVKKILSLQIGDPNRQYVIDARVIPIKVFKNLLESKLVILHNSKFDYKFLKTAGIILNKIYDTMLAECILYCGYEKYGYGLKDLCYRYLDITLNKDVRGEFYKVKDQPFTTEQILYAAKDVQYLHTIREMQLQKIKKWNLEYCLNLENEVVKALADIEYNGMYLNKEKWLENTNNFKFKLDQLTEQLDDIVIREPKLKEFIPKTIQTNLFGFTQRLLTINYSSPLQIKNICSKLGYEVDSTDDRNLQKLIHHHEFFKVLQDYREVAKIISTYGEGFLSYINKYTGRVHTSFWQVLNTGRVSSGSKDDNAPNLQNIPASNTFRNCFEARPGFTWVSIDYNGQELRLMADGSEEDGFINILNSGEDLHCYAGSMMFNKTITKADKELRHKAKVVNFGKAYGMGVSKLADSLDISMEESEDLFKKYALAFPKLNNWLRSQSLKAKKLGYSQTFAPCYRKRFYPELETARNIRKNVSNYKPGSEESKLAWREIYKIEGQVERNGGNQPIQGKHVPC